MNATDILTEIIRGGLSGGKSSGGKSGGGGGSIFKDIFGGGPAAAPRSQPAPPAPAPTDIERQARELEDMFGIGREKSPSPPSSSPPPRPTNWDPAPIPPTRIPPSFPTGQDASLDPQRQDAEAQVLIRAAINAAKADGRLTADEQRSLIDQLGGASREAIQFLQSECARPLNVPDFAWSVPLGMEYKVYAVSLAAIDLDTKSESDYLRQLAHGLRLPPEVCAHLHQRYGAPPP